MQALLFFIGLSENLLTLNGLMMREEMIELITAQPSSADRDRFLAGILPGVSVDEYPPGLGMARLSDAFQAFPHDLVQGRVLVTGSGTPPTITLEHPYILLQILPRGAQHAPDQTGRSDFFANTFELIYGRSLDDIDSLNDLYPYILDPYYYNSEVW